MSAGGNGDLLGGRAIIITGAAHGLGAAYARHAAAAGAAVVVNDVDGDGAERVAGEIRAAGGDAAASDHSVTDAGQAADLVSYCRHTFGGLDGLVNNAGVRYEDPSWDDDAEHIRHSVEVNLLGALYCGSAALRVMHKQGRGAIVNASSRAQSGIPTSAVYAATKGALASLTYSWALDMLGHGVRVNAIAPQAQGTGTRRLNEPVSADDPTAEQMAPLVTFLLSDRADGVTGQIIRFGGRRDALNVGLMRHPRNGTLLERAGGWEVSELAEAFDTVLSAQLEPLGAAAVSLAFRTVAGERVRVWHDETL